MKTTNLFAISRRATWRTLAEPLRWLTFGLAVLVSSAASADGYPDKVIKIIVPSGAGSALDLLARSYSKAMNDEAGLNVIVDNKAGAEGVIGVQSVMNSPADGYTMILLSSSMMALNPVMIPKLPYDPLKDVVPIATISKAGLVMNLGTSTTFETAREFVESARANPGKYTCATSSTSLRMACEYLKAAAGIDLLLVPYKTTAAAYVGLASGEIDVVFTDAGSAIPHWKTGRVRGVGVTTPERLPTLPEVPTMAEQGIPDFLMNAWYALYFPAGTPPDLVEKMRTILSKSAESKSVKDALGIFVHEPLHMTGEEMTAMTRSEIERWQKLVRDHDIKVTAN